MSDDTPTPEAQVRSSLARRHLAIMRSLLEVKHAIEDARELLDNARSLDPAIVFHAGRTGAQAIAQIDELRAALSRLWLVPR